MATRKPTRPFRLINSRRLCVPASVVGFHARFRKASCCHFIQQTKHVCKLKEGQLNQEECNTCRHLSPPPPPVTTTTIIRIRARLATNRHSNYQQPFKKLVMIFCDHDTDPLLDPPKSRPQNGCRF